MILLVNVVILLIGEYTVGLSEKMFENPFFKPGKVLREHVLV